MAKKGIYRGCHFHLFKFLQDKWQKTANRKLNSRGGLCFKKSFDWLKFSNVQRELDFR